MNQAYIPLELNFQKVSDAEKENLTFAGRPRVDKALYDSLLGIVNKLEVGDVIAQVVSSKRQADKIKRMLWVMKSNINGKVTTTVRENNGEIKIYVTRVA